MKKILAILILSTLLLNCNSSSQKENELMKKENELLKRELEIQKKENELSETKKPLPNKKNQVKKKAITKTIIKTKSKIEIAQEKIIELKSLLNKGDWEIMTLDNYGNFSFDMGSASAGRVSGNLKDIIISIEHKPERPGCADICPPTEIIHFKCLNGNKCVKDPAFPKMGSHSQGVISFENLKLGKTTYKLLSEIQNKIK